MEKAFARRIGAAAGAAWSWLQRLDRKLPVTGWDEAAVRFRRQSNDLVARRWPALTLTTLVSHVGLYLVFLLTTRLMGITAAQVSWVELLGIFSPGRLLTAAPITPGGVGLAEVTYIAGLVLAGGGQIRAQAVAARCCSGCSPMGCRSPWGFTYIIWQRNTSWRRPTHPDTPTAIPVPELTTGAASPAGWPDAGSWQGWTGTQGTAGDPQATRQTERTLCHRRLVALTACWAALGCQALGGSSTSAWERRPKLVDQQSNPSLDWVQRPDSWRLIVLARGPTPVARGSAG